MTGGLAPPSVSITSNGDQADGRSFDRAISADGRFVAFTSYADNLVSGDVNNHGNIFVHDRQTGITERSRSPAMVARGMDFSYPSISSDGRYVAFHSWASNLVTRIPTER
jgi:Tol biopolymer transport system component